MQKPPHDVARGAPPEAWEPLLRLAKRAGRPLERFLQIEAASGILLFVAAAVALGWANSPWASSYVALWDTPLGVRIGDFSFERSLAWFVNDGLMVVFFFVVGMEIRREIHHGELSEWRRAALPAAAALGGMIVPALLYLAIAGAGPTRAGWGVPMATDIAFAVGVLTLLGKRVPAALRVLLLALAVIDDLGAIVVIALFYSPGVSLTGLVAATLGVLILLTMQAFGVRSKAAFLIPAVIVWAGVYSAGIHPTIAGVILGLLTPVRAWLGPEGFVRGIEKELDHLSHADAAHGGSQALAETLRHIDFVRREAMSPAENQIESLHPWVAFVIMPVFALANAGVSLSGVSLHEQALRVTAGASLGLLLGKPIGVMLACALAIRAGVAALPMGLSGRHVVVLGVTAGIGFTMALFIAQLAFAGSAPLLGAAKLGVLAASGAATGLALALGFVLLREHTPPGTALTADEAEASTEALAGVSYRLSAIGYRLARGRGTRRTVAMNVSRVLKIVEVTAWAVLVVSMAVLLLVSLVGERSRVTLLILYAPRFPLLIPFAVATACAVRPGRRKLLPVAAAAGLVLAIPVLGLELPGRSQQASGTALRVLTYNVYYGRLGADRILAEIEAAHADIVVLQATSSRTDVLFKQRLSGAGTVSVERDFFLHTRLPLRDVHVPPLLEADLPPQFVRYTIDTAKGPIDVYNVHPYSPRNALRWGAHPLDTQHREQQVTALMTDARSRTNPVVIAGDTNLPPLSAIARRHLTGFRDAFEAVGGGLGYTFPTKVPWMRIDRVLCGSGVRPLSVHVGARGASDHMSLLAELEIVGR